METSQLVCIVTWLWFIMKIARLVCIKCSRFLFVCFFFWFLIIISESAGERGLIFLRDLQWRYQNYITDTVLIYTSLNLDMFFRVFLLKVIIVFINTVCALWLRDASIILSLLLTLSRWQTFPGRAFLIQNTFHQPSLLWLLVTSAMSR